jgi:hypothetical protein
MSLTSRPKVYKRGGFWYVEVWESWPPHTPKPVRSIFTSSSLAGAYALAVSLART